jgi:NADH-quinone oxidoreductase subunit L
LAIYNAAWAIPLLPLLGALLSFGVETQRRAAQLCVVFSGLSCMVAAILLGVRVTHASASPFIALFTFFSMLPPEGTLFTSQFQAQIGIQLDALSASFAAAIAFATLLIQAYALTAMRGEAGFRRFFWSSSLLAVGTTGFVLSPNLFDSLIMSMAATAGLYLLISLGWQRADTAVRAMRAMVVLIAGDIALTLGVLFSWIKFGVFSAVLPAPLGQTIADPFSFNVISQAVVSTTHGNVAGVGPRALAVMGIVFVVVALVRSAQFPFHVWLGDAAASAIPVLALAAATVAPLGLFVLARVYPVLAHAPRVLPVMALVAAVSALLAAAIGVTLRNIRRIAVCAVVSELGLGLAALGMGGFGPGLFIAFTSVFTSTLLILAVGNLIRVYRTDDIMEMGGAWTKLRATSTALGAWALLAAGLGLSAYFALSAAFSGADPAGGRFSGRERGVVTVVVVIAAVLGALLAGRLLLTVAGGAMVRRRGFQHDRATDPEPGLRRPVWLALVAAVIAVLVGIPGLQFVFYGLQHQPIGFSGVAAIVSLLTLGCGAGLAVLVYAPGRPATARAGLPPWAVRALDEGLYVDGVTQSAMQPLLLVAARVTSFDQEVTASLAASVGDSADLAARSLGRLERTRPTRYLAGGLIVIAVLALLSVLAATGHLWVHTA